MSIKINAFFRHIPKKYELKVNEKNIGAYFDYKNYVNINKVCENLLTQNDDLLFNALSIFSKHHYKYRDILYHNLQDLTIEKMCNDKDCATYIIDMDLLKYYYEDDVYHEVLHLASGYYDKENWLFYSGFNYFDFFQNQNFGEGLTEGYVELLAQRDTRNNKVIERYDSENELWSSSYFYVNALARQLEILVGKEEMEDMFFKNGFIRLREWLLKYKDERSIMNFFKNCDAAVIALDKKNNILNKKTLSAQEFIFDICREYMPEKLELLRYEKLIEEDKELNTPRADCEQFELQKSKKIK